MNRRIKKLTIVILLFTVALLACRNDDKMTLEMEVYHGVFENVMKGHTGPLKMLIRIAGHLIDQFEFGDSVIVVFVNDNSQLVLDTITSVENPSADSSKFMLRGSFVGIDEITKDALIGFEFYIDVSKKLTHTDGKTTKIIVASFTSDNRQLIFNNIDSIKTIDKKPIMFK